MMTYLRFTAPNGMPSRCGIDIGEITEENALAVVFTELPDNPGMCITNAIEHLAKLILSEYIAKISLARAKAPLDIQWFEHYPPTKRHDGNLSRVIFRAYDFVTGEFSHPEWQPVDKVSMIGLGLVRPLKP